MDPFNAGSRRRTRRSGYTTLNRQHIYFNIVIQSLRGGALWGRGAPLHQMGVKSGFVLSPLKLGNAAMG